MNAAVSAVPRYKGKSAFTYVVSTDVNLPNGGPPDYSTTLNFTTHGDSDFFWQKFGAYAIAENDESQILLCQITALSASITNITTGRSYSDNPIALSDIDSAMQWLPIENVWRKKTQIQIELENTDQQISGLIYLMSYMSFIGTKAFY